MLQGFVRGARALLIGVAAVALTACAGLPRQGFNAEVHKDVKRVALIEPAFAGEYLIYNFGHPGLSFGIIGTVAALAHMQSQTSEFTQKIKEDQSRFEVAAELTASFKRELEAVGYEVVVVKAPVARKEWLASYTGLEPGVDAYLDTVIKTSGYLTASATSPYFPAVQVATRLVKRGGGEVVYLEHLSYGYQGQGSTATPVVSDPNYQFVDFDAIKRQLPQAVTGMRLGVDKLGKQVANELRGAQATKVAQQ